MKKLLLLAAALLVLVCACSQKKTKSENVTTEFLPGQKLAELKDFKLWELSGLVTSISNPGMLWTHNDSGNGNQVFLVDDKLNVRLTCVLQGVENRDWEDIAVGPGPEENKNYVYVAEIGDNEARYKYKRIYRFEEPVASDTVHELKITQFDAITFSLPGKRKDTETLLLDPLTKDLYIISKREEPVYLYELKYPQSTTDTLTANEIMSLPFTQIVAGDISPDGRQILLKNYEHIYWWRNPSGKTIAEALSEKPAEVPYEIEPQGESITWSRDTSGFYTVSEKNPGKNSYLYFYKRK